MVSCLNGFTGILEEAKAFEARFIDHGGGTNIDYRPVHDYTMTNDVQYIPPKARVY